MFLKVVGTVFKIIPSTSYIQKIRNMIMST